MKKFQIIFLLLSLYIGSLQAQTFQTNFEESLAIAQTSDKQVLMIFSGSDWCKPCMQLKKSILSQDEFVEFSKDNLVLVEVDFPYRRKNRLPKAQRKYNEQLAEQYNKEGSFPKVLLFDTDGNILQEVAFKAHQSPESFINQIESVTHQNDSKL